MVTKRGTTDLDMLDALINIYMQHELVIRTVVDISSEGRAYKSLIHVHDVIDLYEYMTYEDVSSSGKKCCAITPQCASILNFI